MADKELKPLRRWRVTVYGFDGDCIVSAAAQGGARYKAFKAMREAGYRIDFHGFITALNPRASEMP